MIIFPKTKLGAWSVALLAAMGLLFFLGSRLVGVYQSVPAGETILEDVYRRPGVAMSMLAGFAAGIAAFAVGLLAVIYRRDRALLVVAAVLVGGLLVSLLVGEIVWPH